MSQTFNLIDEKWIPCITSDGTVKYESILQALAGAAQYAEVRDPSPLVTIALHRLLLAVLHRLFGPESPQAWAALWQEGAGRFDEKKLEAYLKGTAIYSRFDLFDDKHPFYQTASLPLGPLDNKTGRRKFVKPIWQMAHELAYSDSMNLFSHFTDHDWETRPAAEAARWLVAFQSFALGGLIACLESESRKTEGSADAGQLVKSALVLAKGDNLFQTLMLNLVHYSADDEVPFPFKAKADPPAWERDNETRPEDRRYDGYLDLLTWQSRRVKLVAERDSKGNLLGVSGVAMMKGFQLPSDYPRFQKETMVGFIKAKEAKSKQDPWPPLGFRSDRDLWRDSMALFQSVAERTMRPAVLSWVDDLRGDCWIERKQIQIDVYGICSNQAKVFFWRHETLPLPLRYLHDKELYESLSVIVGLADQVGDALSEAVWYAVVTALKPGRDGTRLGKVERDAVSRLVQTLGTEDLFWSRLEERFRKYLQELPGDDSHRSTVIRQWFNETLKRAARHAYRQTAGQMEESSRALRAAVGGEDVLDRRLSRIATEYRLAATPEEETADAQT